jgi:hypothetical protein
MFALARPVAVVDRDALPRSTSTGAAGVVADAGGCTDAIRLTVPVGNVCWLPDVTVILT